MTGFFAVDLTSEDFFIGHTTVNYSIQINGKSAIVVYTLFVGDGFWDPDFLNENNDKERRKGNAVIAIYVALSFLLIFVVGFFRPGKL